MNPEIRTLFDQLNSKDDTIRYPAFTRLLEITERPVDWNYAVWDELLGKLQNENSFQRTIGLKLLCNLSQSDGEKRMAAALPEILAHTKDEKFITSRQILQEVWKIAWYQPALYEPVVSHLKKRFGECGDENHANLLRQDILQSLITLAELRHDERLSIEVEQLIESEPEEKNRKAYRTVMKGKH